MCVTARPSLLEAAIGNYERQQIDDLELVVVTNSDEFDEHRTRARLSHVARTTLLWTPPDVTLGACLNMAMAQTTARFVAKFDDDDHYGAHYVSDARLAQQSLAAAVVGKHSYFAFLAASNRTILRFPGREFVESRFLAGGTLLVDREAIGDIRFPDASIGEDGAFLGRCWRSGLAVYATDQFNYLQRRAVHNVWKLPDDEFARDSLDIGSGERLDLVDV